MCATFCSVLILLINAILPSFKCCQAEFTSKQGKLEYNELVLTSSFRGQLLVLKKSATASRTDLQCVSNDHENVAGK